MSRESERIDRALVVVEQGTPDSAEYLNAVHAIAEELKRMRGVVQANKEIREEWEKLKDGTHIPFVRSQEQASAMLAVISHSEALIGPVKFFEAVRKARAALVEVPRLQTLTRFAYQQSDTDRAHRAECIKKVEAIFKQCADAVEGLS